MADEVQQDAHVEAYREKKYQEHLESEVRRTDVVGQFLSGLGATREQVRQERGGTPGLYPVPSGRRTAPAPRRSAPRQAPAPQRVMRQEPARGYGGGPSFSTSPLNRQDNPKFGGSLFGGDIKETSGMKTSPYRMFGGRFKLFR